MQAENPYEAATIPAVPHSVQQTRVRYLAAIAGGAVCLAVIIWVAAFMAESAATDRPYKDLSKPETSNRTIDPVERVREILP